MSKFFELTEVEQKETIAKLLHIMKKSDYFYKQIGDIIHQAELSGVFHGTSIGGDLTKFASKPPSLTTDEESKA